jgi:hypothetical protein
MTLTNLGGTDLRRATLLHTNLSGADVSGLDLSDARLAYTIFADLDLSLAIGLDSVMHVGDSSIGIDTILRSHGKIPDVFLRGCGVPEDIIVYIPSIDLIFFFCELCVSLSLPFGLLIRRGHSSSGAVECRSTDR